jgi:adenosine deaminase
MAHSSDLWDFVQQLPKTETHLHLEGSLPLELARKLDPEKFGEPPPYWRPDFRFHDFAEFQEQFDRYFFHWFVSPQNYYDSCKIVFERLVAQNCVYLEASFHLGVAENLSVPFREVARAIRAASPPELELRLFLGMFRDHYRAPLAGLLDEAITWDEIAGVDLHGFEHPAFQRWSAEVWSRVRSFGKVTKAHAGEFSSAEDVRQAVIDLGVRRVQHGLRAIDDPAVIEILKTEGVTLDMTPISNVKLMAVPSMRAHPIRQFMQAGINCTISTDDPMLFGNSLNGEYMALVNDADFTRGDLVQLARNGFAVADLPTEKKQEFFARLDQTLGRSAGGQEAVG